MLRIEKFSIKSLLAAITISLVLLFSFPICSFAEGIESHPLSEDQVENAITTTEDNSVTIEDEATPLAKMNAIQGEAEVVDNTYILLAALLVCMFSLILIKTPVINKKIIINRE